MTNHLHIVAEDHVVSAWLRHLRAVPAVTVDHNAVLVDLVRALEVAEPYRPHGARQVTVTADLVNEVDRVVRHRITVPEGQTTTTDMDHDGPWFVRVTCSPSVEVPRTMTPEEWGPIPRRCEVWPWGACPDCNRGPGVLHTPTCGALDLPEGGGPHGG